MSKMKTSTSLVTFASILLALTRSISAVPTKTTRSTTCPVPPTISPPVPTTDPNNCLPNAGNAILNGGLEGLSPSSNQPWEFVYKSSNTSGPYAAPYWRSFYPGYKSYSDVHFITYGGTNIAGGFAEVGIAQNVPVVLGQINTLEYVYKFDGACKQPDCPKFIVRVDGRDITTFSPFPRSSTGEAPGWAYGHTRFTPGPCSVSRIELILRVNARVGSINSDLSLDNIFLPTELGNQNPCPFTGN